MTTATPSKLIGQCPPDFTFKVLGPNGASTSTRLKQILSNGLPTVVNFYTSWAWACPTTAKKIEAMASDPTYAEKVNFLLMNLSDDEGDEGDDRARSFGEKHGIKACKMCILDPQNLPDAYQVRGISHTTLIIAKGMLRQNLDGNAELLREQLDEVLSTPGAGADGAEVGTPRR